MANARIEDVEGIGLSIGAKLRTAGIKDTDLLLASSRTPKQRKALAEKTGIAETKILKFANLVDLYRIDGIGAEYSELLEAAGVDTVPELARRNAAKLTGAMLAINEEMNLTSRLPAEGQVEKWIEQAKVLPRMLKYT